MLFFLRWLFDLIVVKSIKTSGKDFNLALNCFLLGVESEFYRDSFKNKEQKEE